jgi:cholinesterase
VRDNIENFGGDPTRITIFGQSAGGASVDLYSYAWTSDPIVAGIITESGTAVSWGLPQSKANSEAAWFNVTATLECGNASTNATAVLSCMRSKNYEEIITAIPPNPNFPVQLGNFIPTVDDIIVFSDTSARTPAAVPMIVGNNDYEAGIFRFLLANSNIYNDSFWSSYDLTSFTCPSVIRANVSVKAGNPIWRYRYFGVFPNMALSPSAGAYHTAELPILFDTTPLVPSATEAEVEIGRYLRGAWAAFAKDPREGLRNYGGGWPEYGEGEESLVRLAWGNQTGTNAVSPQLYDTGCGIGGGSDGDASTSSTALPTEVQASGTGKLAIEAWGRV